LKRLLDLLLVLASLPVTLPVAGLAALAVRIGLGSPVLFVDERSGLRGRPFRLYKFRTMRSGAGDDASRMTRLGSWLRKTSLDELPELWNIVKGEMSLVGPRPLPVRYLSRYSAEQNRRHEVLPGLTGWAQVNGRNSLDWETKFRYDLEYVDAHSMAFDLKILFMTAVQLVRPRGISHPGEATMSEFTGGDHVG